MENFDRHQRLKDLRFKRLIDSNYVFKQKSELIKLQDDLVKKAQ